MDLFVWYGYGAAAFVVASLVGIQFILPTFVFFRFLFRLFSENGEPSSRESGKTRGWFSKSLLKVKMAVLAKRGGESRLQVDSGYKTAKNRMIAVLVCLIVLLIPFGENHQALASSCFALLDTVSVSLLFGLGYWIVKKETPFRLPELLFFVILEIALALTELGVIPFDLYGFGYRPWFAVCFVAFLIAILRFQGVGLALIGYLMFRIGFYENIFDVFIDPILALTSFGYLLQKVRRAVFFQ